MNYWNDDVSSYDRAATVPSGMTNLLANEEPTVVCVDGAGLGHLDAPGTFEGDVDGGFEATGTGTLLDSCHDWSNASSFQRSARRQSGRLVDVTSRSRAVRCRLLSADGRTHHLAYMDCEISVYSIQTTERMPISRFVPRLVDGFQVSVHLTEANTVNWDADAEDESISDDDSDDDEYVDVISFNSSAAQSHPLVISGVCEPSNCLLACVLGALRAGAIDVARMTANAGEDWERPTWSQTNYEIARYFGEIEPDEGSTVGAGNGGGR